MDNVKDSAEPADEHVSVEDTLLLEWTEYAMRALPPTPTLTSLVGRSLGVLCSKHPRLAQEQMRGFDEHAEKLESMLCDRPDCESCNNVRELTRTVHDVAGLGKKAFH